MIGRIYRGLLGEIFLYLTFEKCQAVEEALKTNFRKLARVPNAQRFFRKLHRKSNTIF